VALTNYTELKAAIASWLNRSDLTATIPDLIRLAEARLSRELRVQQMVKVEAWTLAAGSFVLPDGFLEIASLTFLGTPRVAAEYRAPETFFVLDDVTSTGTPRFVTVSEGLIYVGPVPTAPGMDYELRYYAEIPALSDAAPTNWLLAKAPDAYLFLSLSEANAFLMDEPRMESWKSRADSSVLQLNGNDRRLKAKGMGQRARTA